MPASGRSIRISLLGLGIVLPAVAPAAQGPGPSRAASAPSAAAARQQPTNPRLLPDISAVGDFVADLSPDGSTQENGARFAVREVELALQAAVDPYFRGDLFLGIHDGEIAIEQAYLTATALPWAPAMGA